MTKHQKCSKTAGHFNTHAGKKNKTAKMLSAMKISKMKSSTHPKIR